VSLPALIVAALVAGLAMGFTSGWKVQSWRWAAADAERIQAEHENTRLNTIALSRGTERNDRETSDRIRAADAAAVGARNDLERLRLAASRIAPSADPAVAGCADDGRLGRVLELLAESAELVEEGSRRTERLAAETAGLQRAHSEVRRVFLNEP